MRGLAPLAAALLPALSAAAETASVTYLAPGVSLEKITDSTRFYDVGKGAYYWYSHLSTTEELYNRTGDFSFMGRLGERYVKQPEFNPDAFKGLINDNFTSWYNAGSNAIQYWQDCYAPFFKRWDQSRELPHGLTYDKNNLEALAGTQSLEVNMKFYDSWSDVEKGVTNAFDWYMSGNVGPGGGGFFREYYDGKETCKECGVYASQAQDVVDMDKVTSGIFESFGLVRQADGALQLVEQGLIPTLTASDSLTDCALTCYGFTLGADGLVNSLYIADSGDAEYRIEHIYLKVEADSKGNEHLLIFTDEACTKAWHSDGFSKWGLTDICHINTPDELKELYNTLHNPATPMEWTGETEYWSTDTTLGWNVKIGDGTYTSGYENGHPVLFTDAAYEFRNYVKGDVNTPLMEVVNDEYDYRFLLKKNEEKGTLEPGSLKIGTLDKSGTGELRFINVSLTVDTWQVREGSVIIEGTSADIANATIDGTLAIVGEKCKLTLGSGISGSGTIILGDKTSLDLGNQAISLSVTLQGSNASITNGIITGDLILADNVSYTWSKDAGLQLQGNIILGDGATFNFGGETFSKPFTMQGSATIGNGTFDGKLTVADGKRLTLLADTTITGGATLGNESTLDLGGGTYDTSAFTFAGNATIGHGTLEGKLTMADGKRLTLLADTTITGGATLGNESTLDLGGGTYDTSAFTFAGNATIGHGTLEGSLTVAAGKRLTLLADTAITGGVTLENDAAFDMGGSSFHIGGSDGNKVVLNGSATIGHGKLEGSLTVAGGKRLTLLADTAITGGVTLENGAAFDMGGNSFHIGGSDGNKVVLNGGATIGNGKLDGTLSVAEYKSLTLLAGTTITGGVTLANGAALDMGGNTFYTTAGAAENKLALSGHATIGNGVLEGDLTVAASKHLNLNGDLSGTGTIYLKDRAELDLGGHALSHSISLTDSKLSATIRYGALNGDVTMGKETTLRLNATISGTGSISLGNEAVLDLVGCTSLTNSVSLAGSEAHIQGKGLNGRVTVGGGKELWLRGNLSGTGAISLGANAKLHLGGYTYSGSVEMSEGALVSLDSHTAIKTREGEDHAVLENVSVSIGLIAGTDSSALMDGLYIDHKGYDLTLQDLTLTDNNSILVGENNTITLNHVTVKLSEEHFDRENPQDGVYYFDLTDLFHCSVDMEEVVFNASGLTLPEGFDLGTGGIGFNFGEAVNMAQATNLTMLLGGYGSQTMGMDEQGNPVFRKLVSTPEPATGTLSLLALAALAARRRKDN